MHFIDILVLRKSSESLEKVPKSPKKMFCSVWEKGRNTLRKVEELSGKRGGTVWKEGRNCSVTKTLDGSIFPKRPALDQLNLIEYTS